MPPRNRRDREDDEATRYGDEADPNAGFGTPEYDPYDYSETYPSLGQGLSDFDTTMADIPILGDLFGSSARRARAAAETERRRRAAALAELAGSMPGEDRLSVEYGNEDWLGDETAEGALARENWTEWAEGGLTDADRAMMEEARRRTGATARASREADLSALGARGMGGSGSALAAMLDAGEGAADRNASMDATMMGAAQQRQIGATGALGEFAATETAYDRGREGRNTDRENRTRESAAEAAQRAYENRERYTAMSTGMNPYGGADPNEEADEADESAGNFLSSLFDF